MDVKTVHKSSGQDYFKEMTQSGQIFDQIFDWS